MIIENYRMIPEQGDFEVGFRETPNISGYFKDGLPDTIVLHYTGSSSLDSAIGWLTNRNAKASAHFVVGKDGKIVQLAPVNTITWHAGISMWKNRHSLNNFSIGIEIENAGLLEKRANGYATWYNKRIDDELVVLAKHKNKDKEEAWEAYTAQQIEAVECLCSALIQKYGIKEIVGHDDISPGRKVDPGPAFPMVKLRDKILFGRKDDDEEGEIDIESQVLEYGSVTANLLNIRSLPNGNAPTVSAPLALGTKVKILDKQGKWYKVSLQTEGWVNARFVK
jgi:N-acetylmuramoyl-L-alanine amidase